MKTAWTMAAVLTAVVAGMALAQQQPPRLTGPEPMPEEVPAPQLEQPVEAPGPRMRLYPEQAPTIPHEIEGYEVSINANRCMQCHRRQYTEATGAPMISVTHYQDRQGQLLADVAPRRYVCTVCHVPQTDARPLVENEFLDVLEVEPGGGG